MKPLSSFVMVIFGATGDLTARKLMPALYSLFSQGILSEKFFIVGVSRRGFSHEEFREMMRKAVKSKASGNGQQAIEKWKIFEKNIYYQQGLFEDKNTYGQLINLLSGFDKEIGACITRFFYLATPPENYSVILKHLDGSKLAMGCGQESRKWTRILIEKPFGKDLAGANMLEEQLSDIFKDHQIYRIDHYLAKETIQNIMALRFSNRFFEPLWNCHHIDNIQITFFEKEGIGNRGAFYDGVGATRDVAQNHLMAMLAYTAMDEPETFRTDDIRTQRIRVLEAIRCINPTEVKKYVVRGQYDGYRYEKNVKKGSVTETYVAFKLFIDNRRWEGVPFYLRTGKKMKHSLVQIDIQFKKPDSGLYSTYNCHDCTYADVLSIRVQPREGITLRFFAKEPGLSMSLAPVDMNFSYSSSFKKDINDSYEKILLDALLGDQTLFATNRGFKATWEFITKIIIGWNRQPPPEFPNYRNNSDGPEAGNAFIRKDNRKWLVE